MLCMGATDEDLEAERDKLLAYVAALKAERLALIADADEKLKQANEDFLEEAAANSAAQLELAAAKLKIEAVRALSPFLRDEDQAEIVFLDDVLAALETVL